MAEIADEELWQLIQSSARLQRENEKLRARVRTLELSALPPLPEIEMIEVSPGCWAVAQ